MLFYWTLICATQKGLFVFLILNSLLFAASYWFLNLIHLFLFAGIYVGENKVVHFTCDGDLNLSKGLTASSSSSSEGFSCDLSGSCSNQLLSCSNIPDCGFKKPESGVVLTCLDCFLGEGSVYRFEYGVSSLAFVGNIRGGTCTTAKSDSPKSVIYRGMYLLHEGFGNYDVFTNNCEDFALYCKTGLLTCDDDSEALGRSGQVYGALVAPFAAVLTSPLRLFMSSPVSIAAAGVSWYCFSRYAADVGVRCDVIKVEVEDVVSFCTFKGKNKPIKDNKRRKASHSLDQTDSAAPKRQRFS